MDNGNTRIEFVNGSSITVVNKPRQGSERINADIQRRLKYIPADLYTYDLIKASVESLVKSFEREYAPDGQYEFVIEDGRITIKEKDAPDFGELSPSQELNNFIFTLNQGE